VNVQVSLPEDQLQQILKRRPMSERCKSSPVNVSSFFIEGSASRLRVERLATVIAFWGT